MTLGHRIPTRSPASEEAGVGRQGPGAGSPCQWQLRVVRSGDSTGRGLGRHAQRQLRRSGWPGRARGGLGPVSSLRLLASHGGELPAGHWHAAVRLTATGTPAARLPLAVLARRWPLTQWQLACTEAAHWQRPPWKLKCS